jgi:hypothetical protein
MGGVVVVYQLLGGGPDRRVLRRRVEDPDQQMHGLVRIGALKHAHRVEPAL